MDINDERKKGKRNETPYKRSKIKKARVLRTEYENYKGVRISAKKQGTYFLVST